MKFIEAYVIVNQNKELEKTTKTIICNLNNCIQLKGGKPVDIDWLASHSALELLVKLAPNGVIFDTE